MKLKNYFMTKNYILLMLFFIGITSFINAQEVTGTVVDEQSIP